MALVDGANAVPFAQALDSNRDAAQLLTCLVLFDFGTNEPLGPCPCCALSLLDHIGKRPFYPPKVQRAGDKERQRDEGRDGAHGARRTPNA